MDIDFSSLKGTMNNMIFELFKMGLLIFVVYIATCIMLKALRIPELFRDSIAVAAVLMVLYYAIMSGYILQI